MRMRILIASMGCVLATAGVSIPEQDTDSKSAIGVEFRVAAIRIALEPYGGKDGLMPGGQFPGTNISVLATSSDWRLVALDSNESKLSKFECEKGSNLLSKKPRFSGIIGAFPAFSSDAKACLIDLSSGGTPAPGATKILIEGTLAMTVGRNPEIKKGEEVAVKKGTKFEIGGIPFEVKSSGKPQWGEDPFEITLAVKKDPRPIVGIRFLDGSGKEIKAERKGSSTSPRGGSWSYHFKEKIEGFTLEVERLTETQDVEVPLKLEVSVGF